MGFVRKLTWLTSLSIALYRHALATTFYAMCGGWRVHMKKWQCVICGFIYDEALGWPDEGIAPGTRWEDVPADWLCPDCGASKADFEMIEL